MIDVAVIPAFRNNYLFVVSNGTAAVAVDPGDARPVLKVLRPLSLPLAAVLVTHAHPDHIGGVEEVAAEMAAPVYGPRLREGEAISASGMEFTVIDTPGHLPVHVSFYMSREGILFPGDTIFAGGCGKVWNLPHEMLHRSLQKLARLPDETIIYYPHEYTEANLRFGLTIEPGNQAIRQRLEGLHEPLCPTTLGLERETNVFLRARTAEEFAERRRLKDVFV